MMMRLIKRRWPIVLILVVVAGAAIYGYCVLRMPARAAQPSKGKALYRCPMHPSYTSERPGDCPICGMKLVPVTKQEQPQRAPTAGNVAPAGPMVAGQAAVHLTPEKQQMIGVRTAPVARLPLTKTIRAVGQVTADETAVSRVYTKVGGWVDKLYVNTTGTVVRKGQPLLSIYSPELVATQEEYLLALRARSRLKESSFAEVAQGGDSLLAATRRRLELWDVPESEIRRIERTGHPIKSITLYAPASGYVMEKAVLAGQKVDPTTELMVVADLDDVWVQAEFYEVDVQLIRPGQAVTMTVNSYPELTWRGSVDYLYPTVDPQTRTLRARVRLANRGLMLKPGMYANLMIEKRLGEQLVVPAEAVLDSGKRQIVFVDRGGGHFEPREVKLGERANDQRVVLSGLGVGEPVVISGNFLIDSESRLQAAAGGMEPMPGMAHEHGTAGAGGRRQTGAAGKTQPRAVPHAPTLTRPLPGRERSSKAPSKGMEGMPGM